MHDKPKETMDLPDENSKDPDWQPPVEVPGTRPQEYPDRELPVPSKEKPPKA